MTADEFNEKYSDYLEEGHYGLDITIPEAVEYLDRAFEGLIRIPGFQYSQIKSKYNTARFYSNLGEILGMIGRDIDRAIELKLDFYLQVEEAIYRRSGNLMNPF